MKFEEWLSQQNGVIEVDCGCVTTEAFYHWMRVAYEAGNSPVIPDGYVMVPKEPTDEMLAAAKEWTGLTSTAEVVYIKMLAAAPQLPGSEPATVPGKWIPVSEQKPDCWCLTCRPVTLNDMRFVVCPDCGNKRCPRANDHRNSCTGSNEPGQEGSAYPDTTQEPKP